MAVIRVQLELEIAVAELTLTARQARASSAAGESTIYSQFHMYEVEKCPVSYPVILTKKQAGCVSSFLAQIRNWLAG